MTDNGVCDACTGTGHHASGLTCMCGGSGKLIDAVTYLRGQVAVLKARFDLVAHLAHLREWSRKTFGPALRTAGVLEHIRKELNEIREKPDDLDEWIDVVILAFDGAWRHGHEPEAIVQALIDKQARNEQRVWPDWRERSEHEAIEHDRRTASSTSTAKITTPLDELRPAVANPARLSYMLGRLDAYARQAGDIGASDLIRKIAKCVVADNGGPIANRLLSELTNR